MPEPPRSAPPTFSPQQALHEALAFHRQGQLAPAERLYRRILEAQPGHFDALQLLGAIRLQEGNNIEAVKLISAALRINAASPAALSNLGVALENLHRHADALASCDHALALKPADVEALHNRSRTLVSLGRLDEAMTTLDRVFAIKPNHVDALLTRGNTLRRLNRLDQAVASYEQALALKQDFVDAHHNLGAALRAQGKHDEALARAKQALARFPDLAVVHASMGFAYQDQGLVDEAARHFERALALKPDYAEIKFALCMAQLPILYADEPEISKRRAGYEKRLAALAEEIIQGTAPRMLARGVATSQPFYLAYQGRNDRSIQRLYGSLVCGIMADQFPPVQLAPPPKPGERVRVGIVSGFFRNHSTWKIPTKGWLGQLDRFRFQLLGYHTGLDRDAETKIARDLCERFVQGLPSVDHWRRAIAADAPHVLIFPEIGMDQISAQLAAQRLAPVQCNSWGHPDTSGFPTIDYYLSSELMEPPGAQDHYTERLVRLPNLSIYYEPVQQPPPPLSRSELQLRPRACIYWCGQSLFKYLPQYYQVFPRIAREVKDCQFVFIQFQLGANVDSLFWQRLERAFAAFGLRAADYCMLLPRLEPDKFMAAMGQCDILLDSIGWSGCNSTLESLHYDVPIVTMAGPLMRGRHGAAILRMMGLEGTVTATVDGYVLMAVRLARDLPRRLVLKERIAQNKQRVYSDKTCITALENFLDRAVRNPIKA